jgi:hypothetical protein
MPLESEAGRKPSLDELDAAIRSLVEEYRATCLWFWRKDYVPETREARIAALRYIKTYGDRAGFLRASELLRWL